MKNIILTVTFILTSFLQLTARNAPKSSTLNVVKNEKAVVLNYTIITQKQKMFTITNKLGVTIFTDIIEENKKRVKYDLKTLPSGNYSIKIEGNNSVEIYDVIIAPNSVNLINSKSFSRPKLLNMNNKVIVTSDNLNNENIQVSIYDNSKNLVYRFHDQKTGVFKKSFNLEQLAQGNYNIIVSTDYFSQSSKISL